jgi:hypothetical protein
MTPLQKRAFYGLVFGAVWIIAIIIVFLLKGGVGTFDDDRQFRSIIDVLWIGGLVVYLILFETLRRKHGQMDERDKLIMDFSPRVQWMAVIFTLVAWVIALSEIYHEEGAVPVIFLFLIFMSVLIVSMIAQCLGILIDYWRMNRNG